MGSALHVPLPLTRKGDTVSVKIVYKTTEEAPALLWLEKEYVDHRSNFAHWAITHGRRLDL